MNVITSTKYLQYLQLLQENRLTKIVKLEFLNSDGSVAFALSNKQQRGYNTKHQSSAFIQSGTLNVSLQNGIRRNATITLSNIDNNFSYNVNNIWFGSQIRLMMGTKLFDNTEIYFPQLVGYISNPSSIFNTNSNTITFPLVDKWAYLDGSLNGTLPNAVSIPATIGKENALFQAIANMLQRSLYTGEYNTTDNPVPISERVDSVTPIFTNYYKSKTYIVGGSDETIVYKTDIPRNLINQGGSTISKVILDLNDIVVGLVGYDQTGAFRLEPSESYIDDMDKPVLWHFTPENSHLCSIKDTIKMSEVYNDIIVVGETTTGAQVWGRAINRDSQSNTNVGSIGLKTKWVQNNSYIYPEQCISYASYLLKKQSVLRNSISITCSQMYHLNENRVITVKRTDKKGSPIEKHLINSFSLPIGESGAMTINATSINDIPIMSTTSSAAGGSK